MSIELSMAVIQAASRNARHPFTCSTRHVRMQQLSGRVDRRAAPTHAHGIGQVTHSRTPAR